MSCYRTGYSSEHLLGVEEAGGSILTAQNKQKPKQTNKPNACCNLTFFFLKYFFLDNLAS